MHVHIDSEPVCPKKPQRNVTHFLQPVGKDRKQKIE